MAEKLDLDALEAEATRLLDPRNLTEELGYGEKEDQQNIIALVARIRELEAEYAGALEICSRGGARVAELNSRIRALESASNAGGAVAWQVRAIGSELWENCTRELYEETLRTGRYCGFERAPECEVRELFAHPAPASKEPVADEPNDFDSPLSDFQEGQWWINELDAWASTGTDDQKRAIAVVHHMLRSARAALATAQTPEGWRLVPVEPTERMVEDAIHWRGDIADIRAGRKPAPISETRQQYRAMLAAAPAKPEGV